MAKLIISADGENQEFDLEDGAPIAEACENAGVPLACTEGVCGTCVVEVLEGANNLTEFSEAEQDFLGEPESSNERLACQCCIKSGCVKLTF
ncbi:(2Fe-2S)-binding protein [Chlamydia suis]|uniref:(2Fe-2S)-binding protein n=1 Tax=Chlamydia suis TaxID=83559 RepID=A0AAQ0EM60_9CHLA|nr:2Fe-2S iron-sulfur cluster-binding protein [Chlamydia suis]MEB2680870.1 2Fe-2S iron-sulfur cluster-binding protein [Chlamydia suis]MEB2682258.1 2Fe-2S iron-sulfur cluster-binding protein [Chlamydia suis]MEB2683182.1 2Fe-2S iron-sulfur cluster-binding protein [Chlamydia suis]MEB2683578.1 2Fe-2S iron-sulfur cluster-binding protein [Chlamydia suis]MEB2684996.1 2Fe-2S iron-sulfur cluster-binding protein [Chlamydia suis]